MRAPTKQSRIDALERQVAELTAERHDLLIERDLLTRTMEAQQHTITHLTQERDAMRAEWDATRDRLSGMDMPAVDAESLQEETAEPVPASPEDDDAMQDWKQGNNCAFGRHAAHPLDADKRRPYCMHCGDRFTAYPRLSLRLLRRAVFFVGAAVVSFLLVVTLVQLERSAPTASPISPTSPTPTGGVTTLPRVIEAAPPRPALPPGRPATRALPMGTPPVLGKW
jgi:hypothetical protein